MISVIAVPYRAFLGILILALLPFSAYAQNYELSMGDDYGAMIDEYGNLFVWGAIEGGSGEIEQILPAESWKSVAVSRTSAEVAHILAIRTDGSLWAWGKNDRGQLGDGSQIDRVEPVQIGSATNWKQVAAGQDFSVGLREDGFLYTWGDNSFGQLGYGPIANDPSIDIEDSPRLHTGGYFQAISAGSAHVHAIRSDGTLWTWGTGGRDSNAGYALGILVNGSFPIGPVLPTQVGSKDGWTALYAGDSVTYAIRDSASQTGQLWVWGADGFLGNGQTLQKTPGRVGNGTGWVSVSKSGTHTLALKSDGSLWGWGLNDPNGQLGLPLYNDQGSFNFSNIYKTEPVELDADAEFLAVGAGEDFSAIIRSDGFLLTAGLNTSGQLANGSNQGSGQDYFETTQLGIADLVATSLSLSTTSPTPGSTVTATLTLTNEGTGLIERDFNVAVVLNTTTEFENGTALTFSGGANEITVIEDIASGDSISVSLTLDIPANVNQGNYYFVAKADASEPDLVDETNEDNNTVATDSSFDFSPDLTVPSGGLLVVNTPGDGVYDPNTTDTIDIELDIENSGNGTLPAGTEFDLRLFLTPERSDDNSEIIELESEEPVALSVDLLPGQSITPTLSFSYSVPRMPAGYFYVAATLDVNEDVIEQEEITDDNDLVTQVDGEANNTAYSATLIEVSGLTIKEAIDQDGSALVFSTSGDGEWFGQSFVSNDGVDSVQSPSLDVGESATFSTSFSTPVAITFDWNSQTSSSENRAYFQVVNGTTGGTDNEISGNTGGWIDGVARVVPASGRAEWVFEQGVEATGDAVYVDNLQFVEIDEPDLVIDDIYLTGDDAGSYTLMSDRLDLTVNSRNQGVSTTSSDQYVISIYLSKDSIFDRPDSDPLTADDILLRQVTVTKPIEEGDPAVNALSIELDTEIDPGAYYVIGYIDDYTDASGAILPGASAGSGQLDEFTDLVGAGDAFPGEDNNLFISDSAIVEIVSLADLQVTSISSTPSFYYVTDPASGYVNPNSMSLSFTIANEGLAGVYEDFGVAALFSKDESIDPETDYSLLDYTYENNLSSVDEAANSRQVNPGEIDFRDNLVSEGYIGERLFLGVYVDSEDSIAELDEDNNTYKLSENNFILSELTIVDGLDLSATQISDLSLTVTNDEVAPYNSDSIPWVGQTSETFDDVDAVTNVIVGNNETSSFSVDISPSTGIRVSFWWKVSSQNEEVAGSVQRDVLRFEVNGETLDGIPDIFGNEDTVWQRVELTLPAGDQTLTWSYIKDDEGSAGEDRGWVDQLTITELPNLQMTGITVDGSLTYQAGDSINTWSIEVINDGDAIEPGAEFDVEVRLLPEANWTSTAAVGLLTLSDAAGIGAGETRVYNQSTHGPLTLPLTADYESEYYYFAAYVDWSAADPTDGQISESNELDNTVSTDEASIQLGRPDITGSGSSVSGFDAAGYEVGDAVNLQLDLVNIGDGILSAGSSFDYVLYIARSNDEQLFGSSSVVELGDGTVTLAADVASGAGLPQIDFSGTMPYGLAVGNYYLAVRIDSNNDIEEQDLDSDGSGVDGEENNLFYTAAASYVVDGISLQDALDDGLSALPLGSFEQSEDNDADWFGRSDVGSADSADDQTFEQAEGAQSPDLQLGEQAAFSLTVADSSLVRFDWAVSSGSDLNVLAVYVNGLPYVYEDVQYAISGEVALYEVDPAVLVPSGGTIEWRYSKGAATVGDFAVVDNVRVETNDQPDLVVTALDYTAGEYVLDVAGIAGAPEQLLGTEYLDIVVEAKNQGSDVTATAFTVADIEVRLSVNEVYGDEDDIILGTFSEVEGDLLSGNLIRFIGPIQLGDSIPAGSYHLMARIDSNDEVAEFSELNNVVISGARDVVISRLPALRIANPMSTSAGADTVLEIVDVTNNIYHLDPSDGLEMAVDLNEGLLYYTEGELRMKFDIQNIGLGNVKSSDEWTTQINLRGIKREDVASADASLTPFQDFVDAVDPTLTLGTFTVEEFMAGRSEANPSGSSVAIDLELALPSEARLLQIIEDDYSFADYLWFIEVVIDSTSALTQSEIVNEATGSVAPVEYPWWILNIQEILDSDSYLTDMNTSEVDGAFGITRAFSSMDATTWELLYPGYSTADSENLLAYAFNRSPSSGDTAGDQFPGSYGVVEIEGDEYLSISFDIVTRATDLTYVVQAADDVAFTTNQVDLLTINVTNSTGYTDLTGPASLTGDGGLIDADNVVSVLDQGYAANVTVQDEQTVGTSPTRFIRIIVDGAAASAVSSD
ncbi:CARDB domain-containing protein [Coraliomargarita sp. SDUM461004]|uniref:CARDB domain-containing protein n=1 Tax=Thalassobacterium sedimentorum TaxID=3041258 RepID=A0ABU1AEI4_9BACT|nr:CARDB domain-containing protein [Coraliomargarita sp. SDUM461004]MDQ8193042.1 CARDB domain-containing protein [Coraliomargarita sp. SDUM461004]